MGDAPTNLFFNDLRIFLVPMQFLKVRHNFLIFALFYLLAAAQAEHQRSLDGTPTSVTVHLR
jgi:hypothetical protein